MSNLDNIDNNLGTCLACLGGKHVFNGVEFEQCTFCNGTGEATDAENEYFLNSEINYN